MAGHVRAESGGGGLEFRPVFRLEDARRALVTPLELEEERAREMGTLARVPLFLTYDNGYAPIHRNLVRQEEGDKLPSLGVGR